MRQTISSPVHAQTTGGADYVIRLDNFEGPLDLLLHLIERRELDITAVAIAAVTDQYLDYLARAENVSPRVMADFIAMAARLLLIKSRALLPTPVEEEEEEEDPAEALARQLRVYKQFRRIAHLLSERERAHLRAYVRVAPPPDLESRLKPGDATINDLVEALRRVLEEHQEVPVNGTVVTPYTVTIQDKIGELRALLQRQRRLDFTQLLRQSRHRQEIIVTFLAVLELIKQEEVRVRQEGLFGPIHLELAEVPDS